MATNIKDLRRVDKTKTTPILRSQRSSCVVVFHRYSQVDITKLVSLNATNDKTLASKASQSTSGNLNIKPPLTIRQDITRCSITNSKDGGGGNFSLTIKRGKKISGGINTNDNVDYLQAIHPGDWIMIYMKKNGQITDNDLNSVAPASGLKFLGIVENIRYVEIDDPSRGSPRLEFLVTGRSFAKVFDTNIFFNPVVNQQAIQSVLGVDLLTDSKKTISPLTDNSPDFVMKKVIKFYLNGSGAARSAANQNWYVPTTLAQAFKSSDKNKTVSRSFVDILTNTRIGMHKYTNGQFKTAGSMSSQGAALIKSLPSSGTIWSIMQYLQNSALNEMYTELVPVTDSIKKTTKLMPSVVLRQMPFSNKEKQETSVFKAHNTYTKSGAPDVPTSFKSYFTDLPKLEIVSSDIKQKNVGKSDHERINYVIVVPRIDSNTYDIQFVAGSNPPSVQRYGLKTFQAQTQYVLANNNSTSKQGIVDVCSRAVYLLQDWFFLVHNLYNGTIIIDGRDDFIELGTNLYIKDIQQLYHIEGYTHSYEISPDGQTLYTTELRVSRGQVFNKDNSISKFIGISKQPQEPTTVVTSFVQRSKEQ